jgi:hypothetical protein
MPGGDLSANQLRMPTDAARPCDADPEWVIQKIEREFRIGGNIDHDYAGSERRFHSSAPSSP